MGRLEQDAGTVARVRVAAGGPAVGKVLDCRYGLGDDIVGFSAVDVDDCHDATGSSCNRRFVAAFNESMMLIQFCCSVPRNLMSKSHLGTGSLSQSRCEQMFRNQLRFLCIPYPKNLAIPLLPLESNQGASSDSSFQKLVGLTVSVANARVVSRSSEGGCARIQTISHRLHHSCSYRDLKACLHFRTHFLVHSAASGSALCKLRSI